MRISDRIMADLKEALRARESVRVSCLRMARAEALKRSKAEGGNADLDDDDWIGILSSLIKQRKESAAAYRSGDRIDRAELEEAEAAILQGYLPAPFSTAEIEALARQAIEELGASSPRDMGKVMGRLRSEVRGRADGKTVAGIVRSLLVG